MLSRLNVSQATEILARRQMGRLGCITETGPYVVPISYYFLDGSAYSHSLLGLKIYSLRKDPRACLQVDEIESVLHWRSVLAFGSYEEIEQPSERSEILNKIMHRFPLLTPVESAIAGDAEAPPVIVFRIKVEQITGVAEE